MKPQRINRRRPPAPRITPPQPWEIGVMCVFVLIIVCIIGECQHKMDTIIRPDIETEMHMLKTQNTKQP